MTAESNPIQSRVEGLGRDREAGVSGVGTHLALKLAEAAKKVPELAHHPTLVSPVQYYVWPDILNQLKRAPLFG